MKEVDLDADGIGASLAVSHEEVYRTIMPLVHFILQKRRDAIAEGRTRVLIGIGGSGGSGAAPSSLIIRLLITCHTCGHCT